MRGHEWHCDWRYCQCGDVSLNIRIGTWISKKECIMYVTKGGKGYTRLTSLLKKVSTLFLDEMGHIVMTSTELYCNGMNLHSLPCKYTFTPFCQPSTHMHLCNQNKVQHEKKNKFPHKQTYSMLNPNTESSQKKLPLRSWHNAAKWSLIFHRKYHCIDRIPKIT